MATDDEVRDLCSLLHARGREATPEQVREWLARTKVRLEKHFKREIDEGSICRLALKGHKEITMVLHLHFGDAI